MKNPTKKYQNLKAGAVKSLSDGYSCKNASDDKSVEKKGNIVGLWQIMMNLVEFAVDTIQMAFNISYCKLYIAKFP